MVNCVQHPYHNRQRALGLVDHWRVPKGLCLRVLFLDYLCLRRLFFHISPTLARFMMYTQSQNDPSLFYNQAGPMYVSKYQIRYLNKKYKTKRDTTKINPIPTPIIPPSWNGFIVLRLSGRPVSLLGKPLLCSPESGEPGTSMTRPGIAGFHGSAKARMVPANKVMIEKTVPRQPNPTN